MKRLGVIKAGAMRVQVYMCYQLTYQLTLINYITVRSDLCGMSIRYVGPHIRPRLIV